MPIIAVISETMALISKKEGRIRLLSLFSTPFWFVYNILCGAYGGAVGNVITLITIGFAIVRFDIGKKQREDAA